MKDCQYFTREYDPDQDRVHSGYKYYQWGDGHGRMKLITYRGITTNMTGWSELSRRLMPPGIPYNTLRSRVKVGWNVDKIFTTPIKERSGGRSGPKPRSAHQKPSLRELVQKHAGISLPESFPHPQLPSNELRLTDAREYWRQLREIVKQLPPLLINAGVSGPAVGAVIDAITSTK